MSSQAQITRPALRNVSWEVWACAAVTVTLVAVSARDSVVMVGLIVVAAVVAALLVDVTLAPCILALVLPFNVVRSTDMGFTVSTELIKLLVIPVAFIAWYRSGGRLSSLRTSVDIPIAIYVSLLLLSIVRADDRSFAGKEIGRALSNFAVFYMVLITVRTESHLRRVVKSMLAAGFIIAAYGLYQIYIDDYGAIYQWFSMHISDYLLAWHGRATSILDTDNELGAFINFYWPSALLLSDSTPGAARGALTTIGVILAALVFLVTLVLTFSRGAWMGCAAAIGLLLLKGWKAHPKLVRSMVIGLICVALVLGLAGTFTAIAERSTADDQTVLSRVEIWSAAFMLFRESPMVGIGYGNFRSRYGPLVADIASDSIGAHNFYLFSLAQMGVVGLLALAWVIGSTIRKNLKLYARKPSGTVSWFLLAAACSLLTVFVHGLVDDVGMFATHTQFMVFLLLGLSHACHRIFAAQDVPTGSE